MSFFFLSVIHFTKVVLMLILAKWIHICRNRFQSERIYRWLLPCWLFSRCCALNAYLIWKNWCWRDTATLVSFFILLSLFKAFFPLPFHSCPALSAVGRYFLFSLCVLEMYHCDYIRKPSVLPQSYNNASRGRRKLIGWVWGSSHEWVPDRLFSVPSHLWLLGHWTYNLGVSALSKWVGGERLQIPALFFFLGIVS